MRYATTPQASQLTGLSTVNLREWTCRRALIPADIKPRCQGSPAKYTWQTILLLRIAVTARDRFHLELQAHRALFASLRRALRGASLIGLWDKILIFYGAERWELVDEATIQCPMEDAIVIRLNPHLDVLALGFALARPPPSMNEVVVAPTQRIRDDRT